MSMDLRIYGIRKLDDREIAEFTGKTTGEILRSQFFRQLFPTAPSNSRYEGYFDWEMKDNVKSIRHMFTPIETAEDGILYVYWIEELAYYWRNLSHEDPRIYEILDEAKEYVDYDQDYCAVPDGIAGRYLNEGHPTCPETEILAISYG